MADHEGAVSIEQIAALAEALGVAIRPDHLQETAQAWTLMAPHRERVAQTALGYETEPAPVFRP